MRRPFEVLHFIQDKLRERRILLIKTTRYAGGFFFSSTKASIVALVSIHSPH
jgi:hypothetical protein